LVFQTPDARRWWTHGGGKHWRALRAKRSDAFANVVDSAIEIARSYDDDSQAPDHEALESAMPTRPSRIQAKKVQVGVAAVGLTGAGVLWWIRKRRR
jgi:hypothetical protein